MAENSLSSLNVCDITECSICLETFKEPKALPCIHTFCLECLDKYCEESLSINTAVIEEAACPLCRKVFTIPPGGIKDLPNNFIILQLLQIKQSTGVAENQAIESIITLCELCSDSKAEIPSTSNSRVCDRYICDRRAAGRKKFKLFKSHQLVRDDKIQNITEKLRNSVSYCDQHPDELKRSYCYNCKIVTCLACIEEKHKKHDWTKLKKSAENLCEKMKDDVDSVSECVLLKQERIKKLKVDRNLFVKRIAAIESEISMKYYKLISLVQSNKSQLMEKLKAFRDEILKEADAEKDQIERQFVIAESFKRYCQEMMNKGTACDISRTAHDLHARAEELEETQDEPYGRILGEVEITFKPFPPATDTVKNFIGELVLDVCTLDPKKFDFTKILGGITLRHVMPGTGRVAGITVLGSEVFVARDTPQVNVYKSDDFTLIRNLTISGSKRLQGLVSCSHYNCLYASDIIQKIIYRYDLTNNVTTNWTVSGKCPSLSLTKCHNLLATLHDTGRVQEYCKHGSLIREISLDSSIDQPWHCIQLQSDNYVVCHEGKQQRRVCIVDQSGRLIQSYCGQRGSDVGQLNSPGHLAVDIHGNVLVADYDNNKVLLLSPTLSYLGDIVIPGDQLNGPDILYFDGLNHRLYIGELYGDRMFILNGNNNEPHFEK